MNLRIVDGPGLVRFLHRIVSETGEIVLSADEMDVVDVGGALFFHAREALSVGGPFRSIEALLRSEGQRQKATSDDSTTDAPDEIYEWAGSFFRIDDAVPDTVRQFADFESAVNGQGPGRQPPGASPPVRADSSDRPVTPDR